MNIQLIPPPKVVVKKWRERHQLTSKFLLLYPYTKYTVKEKLEVMARRAYLQFATWWKLEVKPRGMPRWSRLACGTKPTRATRAH